MTEPTNASIGSITPDPTEEEVAAIAAAVEVAWPKPFVGDEPDLEISRWRFSGRWWSKPLPSRRDRP